MITIKVIREIFTEHSTLGSLFLNGEFFCYTLEDTVRKDGVKVFGETAIPEGTYNVTITPSTRFKKWMFLVSPVPNFSGIRIHSGNIAEDTDGCILVGKTRTDNHIWNSGQALSALYAALSVPDGIDEDINSSANGMPKYKLKDVTKILVMKKGEA